MELMTFELSGECVEQVLCKAVYEIVVAYHDSTEVRTHMAFHQQMRPPLPEKLIIV
jgi:hypothetical protein